MKQIVFLFFALLLTSCTHQLASNKGHEAESIQGGERVRIGIIDKNSAVLGLSFISPNEAGWNIIRSGLSITLTKEGDISEENQEIEAYIIRLDTPFQPISQYIEKIRGNLQESYEDDQDIEIQTLNVEEYPENNQCVRTHLLLKDVRTKRNNQQNKWSEQYTLSCASSVFEGMGYENNKDGQFENKVDALFKSVKIDE